MIPARQREEPYIFFHTGCVYWWRETTDEILRNCQSINEEAVQPFLTSLTVKVSDPDRLVEWLDKNDAAHITGLDVFVDAYSEAPSPARWSILFEKLGREATNLQHLEVYWDFYNSMHKGLGRDLCFIRALTQLKVKSTIKLAGFYAQPWAAYLERTMGLKPVEEDEIHSRSYRRRFQRGTENLIP